MFQARECVSRTFATCMSFEAAKFLYFVCCEMALNISMLDKAPASLK